MLRTFLIYLLELQYILNAMQPILHIGTSGRIKKLYVKYINVTWVKHRNYAASWN